jgi:hypothetical protein
MGNSAGRAREDGKCFSRASFIAIISHPDETKGLDWFDEDGSETRARMSGRDAQRSNRNPRTHARHCSSNASSDSGAMAASSVFSPVGSSAWFARNFL